MIRLPTPSVPELARAQGGTVDDLVDWFVAYFNAKHVPWNYNQSARVNKAAYRGMHNIDLLRAGCNAEKNITARKANCDVVQLSAPIAFGRSTQVFDIPARRFEFGHGLRSAYRIPFFFTEADVVKLYYIQPRKNFALKKDQIEMLATIHKIFILDIDFAGLASDIEYVDVSAPEDGCPREIKRYALSDLELWDYDRLQARLASIAEALRLIQSNGLVPAKIVRERVLQDMPLFA